MAVSHLRGLESSSCSALKVGCLSSPNLVLKVWRIPGKLLVFSLDCNPKKLTLLLLVNQCPNSSIDKLASKSEDSRQKVMFSSFMSFYLNHHQEMPPYICFPLSHNLIHKIPHRRVQQCVFLLIPVLESTNLGHEKPKSFVLAHHLRYFNLRLIISVAFRPMVLSVTTHLMAQGSKE